MLFRSLDELLFVWELQQGVVLMEDAILGLKKAMIESKEPGQGCRRLQR